MVTVRLSTFPRGDFVIFVLLFIFAYRFNHAGLCCRRLYIGDEFLKGKPIGGASVSQSNPLFAMSKDFSDHCVHY